MSVGPCKCGDFILYYRRNQEDATYRYFLGVCPSGHETPLVYDSQENAFLVDEGVEPNIVVGGC